MKTSFPNSYCFSCFGHITITSCLHLSSYSSLYQAKCRSCRKMKISRKMAIVSTQNHNLKTHCSIFWAINQKREGHKNQMGLNWTIWLGSVNADIRSPPSWPVSASKNCHHTLLGLALSISLSTQLKINKMQNDTPRLTLGKGNGQLDRRTYGQTDRHIDR